MPGERRRASRRLSFVEGDVARAPVRRPELRSRRVGPDSPPRPVAGHRRRGDDTGDASRRAAARDRPDRIRRPARGNRAQPPRAPPRSGPRAHPLGSGLPLDLRRQRSRAPPLGGRARADRARSLSSISLPAREMPARRSTPRSSGCSRSASPRGSSFAGQPRDTVSRSRSAGTCSSSVPPPVCLRPPFDGAADGRRLGDGGARPASTASRAVAQVGRRRLRILVVRVRRAVVDEPAVAVERKTSGVRAG